MCTCIYKVLLLQRLARVAGEGEKEREEEEEREGEGDTEVCYRV